VEVLADRYRRPSEVAGDYVDRPSVAPLKRHDTVRDAAELEPLQQRVAC